MRVEHRSLDAVSPASFFVGGVAPCSHALMPSCVVCVFCILEFICYSVPAFFSAYVCFTSSLLPVVYPFLRSDVVFVRVCTVHQGAHREDGKGVGGQAEASPRRNSEDSGNREAGAAGSSGEADASAAARRGTVKGLSSVCLSLPLPLLALRCESPLCVAQPALCHPTVSRFVQSIVSLFDSAIFVFAARAGVSINHCW